MNVTKTKVPQTAITRLINVLFLQRFVSLPIRPPWREDRFEDTWGLSLTESVTFVSIGLVLEHRFDLVA